MILSNGFILDPPDYLKPVYRISPFKTDSIVKNNILSKVYSLGFDKYLNCRFDKKDFYITQSGREAISKALSALNINKNDIITIFTTTNNFYISSCVTKEIEKHCLWSRKIEKNTKALLINHEFGFCSQELEYYKSLGLPIIEDFAHSFLSSPIHSVAGQYGDFLIFSLSKFFPIQTGGILACNKKYKIQNKLNASESYTKNIISGYIEEIGEIKIKRIENYNYYIELFSKINIDPFFKLTTNDCPGVFCFNTPKNINLDNMKYFVNKNGIESSIFYGKNAYFVPCHQNLQKEDIDYIFEVVKYFLGVSK